jgi:hypothetical protein
MDISEIITAFGAYYLNSGQNMARIRGMLTQGLVTPGICTPIVTDDTVYQLGQLSINSIVQAFQKGWTPKNAASITPNEIRNYRFKVDEAIFPDDIEDTWLAFLKNDDVDRKNWPLIKFLIEHPDQGYIAKINSDMELLEYGKGVYVAPTVGVASTTGSGMNGLIKLLQIGVDAETINSIDIEDLDKATIFDQVELFIDGISEIYQHVAMDVCMSPAWAKAYLRDKRVQGFYTIPSDKSLDLGIDFSPQNIKALPSLNGTDVIFATPKVNLIHLTNKTSNKTNIKIESYRREVSFFCDWREGLGFGMDAAVWTNLQHTAPPVGG